ncbi:response regulator transcription factor [Ectopseudomonas khazarica]|uniref:response regulator transcription factor n=1 Tax=Ectopseudomonas khazarica TaxID=2502979 RepID=UPI0040346E31
MEFLTYGGWKGCVSSPLADRELGSLLAVAAGKSDKEFARELGLSPRTIKGAVERCMHKLQVYKRTALVAEALRRGIIAPAACFLLALLVGLQHQQTTFTRRPETPRRVEMRVAARRDCAAWAV